MDKKGCCNMKKILTIMTMIGFIFFIFIGCSKDVITKEVTGDEKTAEQYVKSRGYKIVDYIGESQKYTLDKNKLYGAPDSLLYEQTWGVQSIEPDKYIGKEITTYGFIVKSHPVEKMYKGSKGGKIFVMLSEGKVIGGYSYPNADVEGAFSSIDGKTLEEVTGLSFQQWREEWRSKYSN
jgi:hypothetical protein